jgi:hypothetical protein
MMRRNKESGLPRRPETPWLAAVMIGLTISTLATTAAVMGAGMAVGGSVMRGGK